MTRRKNYQDSLLESLADASEAAVYLNAALEDGDREVILLVLRNVAAPYLNITDYAHYEKALAMVEALMEDAQDSDDDPLNHVIGLIAQAIGRYERDIEALDAFETQAGEIPVDVAKTRERAQRVIEEHNQFTLSNRDRDMFLAALENLPEPNKALRDAAGKIRRHKR